MGQLVTVIVSPKLVDGCAVAKDAVAALVVDGWKPPLLAEARAVHPLEAGPLQKSVTEGQPETAPATSSPPAGPARSPFST